jgi:MFS family permease
VLVAGAPGAIIGNIFPVLGDHRSRRAIAASGAFGYAATLFAFGCAPGFAVLTITSFLMGMAATALISGTELALVDEAGDAVTAYFARAMVFGAAGGVLGPALLIVATAAGFGWRVAFVACAIPMAGYGACLTRLPFAAPARPEARIARALGPILRDPRVWFCGLLAFIVGPLQQPFSAFVIAYLQRVGEAPAALAISVQIGWVAGSLAAAVAASRLAARPGGLTGPAVALLASTAGALVPVAPVVMICFFVNGFAMTRFFLALKTRIRWLHPDRFGSVTAVVSTLEFSSFALPVAAGALADTFGIGAGVLFYAGMAALLVVAASAGARYLSSSRAI